VLAMSRQIGVALGVAVLVSVLGTPAPGEAVARFQDGYVFLTAAALAAAVAIASIGRADGEPAPAPATAPAAMAAESA
jgi:hypothetical protein